VPSEISDDSTIAPPAEVDVLYAQDARRMEGVATNSVALVVTSPPYFAGKQYEESLGVNGVPATYFEYLQLLRDVFAECKRVLEPGGRIAVNVANLGRRPYRSLSGDVTEILQELGLLLRGEVIWWKGRAAGGSCAWGSFQRPANPVLRDITERVVIASKGRFDRAVARPERLRRGMPSGISVTTDEFIEATTDVWELPSESATRVGHPAPFPVELPLRLIELYTYEGDLVLDPFMGSGTTAAAALRSGRHYVGYDTESEYVRIAEQRVTEERDRLIVHEERAGDGGSRRASRPEGASARDVAAELLRRCGFSDVVANKRLVAGVDVTFSGRDRSGRRWLFDVSGAFTTTRTGLRRADTLWKAIGRAAILHAALPEVPVVLLTTEAPTPGSAGDQAWRSLGATAPGIPGAIHDVIELESAEDHRRLQRYASHGIGEAEGARPRPRGTTGPRRGRAAPRAR